MNDRARDPAVALLADATWTDDRLSDSTVVVPVGSCEQHGPHLPLDTDTRIAAAVARRLPDVLVAPAIEYGASGEHEGFAGTVSIGHDVVERVYVEYGRSICRWASRVVFVNGHGGNNRALAAAVTLLRYEGRDAAWWPCAVPGGDAHAGATETSLLLAIAPDVVRSERARCGETSSVSELLPALRAGGMVAVSSSGVLGDPTTATAARGADLLTGLVSRARACLARWTPDAEGRLR